MAASNATHGLPEVCLRPPVTAASWWAGGCLPHATHFPNKHPNIQSYLKPRMRPQTNSCSYRRTVPPSLDVSRKSPGELWAQGRHRDCPPHSAATRIRPLCGAILSSLLLPTRPYRQRVRPRSAATSEYARSPLPFPP